MATRIVACKTSIRFSQSRTSLRHRVIQPKVLSTTQRRSKTLALLVVAPANDLDDEVQIGGLVHELEAIVRLIGEEMFDPRPALADATEGCLSASTVGNIRRGEVDHQQSAIGIDGDVPLAPEHLLACVKPALFCRWSLDRLAVDHARARALLCSRPQRSRSSINSMSWIVWKRNLRANFRNQPYTVCHAPKWIGNIRHLKHLLDFDDEEVEDRALPHFRRHSDFHRALSFLQSPTGDMTLMIPLADLKAVA